MGIVLGRHSYAVGVSVRGESNRVIVGNYSSLATNIIIDCGFQHHSEYVSTYPFSMKYPQRAGHCKGYPYTKGDVIIGSDVWIGENVTIMSGVTIGDGCVVGASAVVTKSIAPYTVVGGVPAKPIKKRFTEQQIEAMLRIQWWHWDDEKVFNEVDLLMSGNIDAFIQKHG